MKGSADIVLLLEGTYPFVRGGVSSWVHQIIEGLPDLSFHLVFLGGTPGMYGDIRYQLPANVTALDVHYVMNPADYPTPGSDSASPESLEKLERYYPYFHDSTEPMPPAIFDEMIRLFSNPEGISLRNFLYSEQAWEQLADFYRHHCRHVSFVDFFWTLRNLFAPLFTLSKLAREIPGGKLYHAISTGYAGFLGAAVAMLEQKPLLLTEHGIYTKERKIDITQVEWIKEPQRMLDEGLSRDMNYLRQMWISFFEQIGRCTYNMSEVIISLYDGNRLRQIEDGAMASRCRVIPNGTRIGRFSAALQARGEEIPMVAALVGRVVPIKDIKTFIRTIKQGLLRNPALEGWVVGPFEEDPEYMEECRLLVSSLGLDGKVKFLGMQDLTKVFPDIGIIVLTSISEAQPLVLLEGMAAGIPCVATRVGACEELILGAEGEDRALGPAGYVVPIASPQQTADAINQILLDAGRWHQFQASGLQRASRFYDEPILFQRYQALYDEVISWPASDLKSVNY
ncbi:GT4 family glycosyltransferase PelF [Marinobacterium jannaschii]|uniref:GT4 family glycosyltransferase PelF n=1 Tax=Marinobacterium jannaschii TaxID=64970 RepID=UPI0004886AC9|nr:GT4 family glycosyltransferase PelF [Marinobacterium jannaschii]